jgi:hypothetical protein
MDRIPTQFIEHLAKTAKIEAYKKVGMICVLRSEGDRSEGDIAKKAGFGSVEAMHRQLEIWGLAGLLLPKEEEEAPPRPRAPEAQRKRKARRGGGESEELPLLADATDLFRWALHTLEDDLAYTRHHREELQDERFVATVFYPNEEELYPDVYRRELVSPERWKEICEKHGKDPESTEVIYVYVDRLWLRGASPFPTQPVVRLIAAYLLCASTWPQVEHLLEKLRPKPSEANRDQVKRLLTGDTKRRRRDDALLPIAKRIARLVRGGIVKRGLNVGRLTPFEHSAAAFWRDERARGVSDEEIRRVLIEDYGVDEDEISRLSEIFPPGSSTC